jgi:hypothetical protein
MLKTPKGIFNAWYRNTLHFAENDLKHGISFKGIIKFLQHLKFLIDINQEGINGIDLINK